MSQEEAFALPAKFPPLLSHSPFPHNTLSLYPRTKVTRSVKAARRPTLMSLEKRPPVEIPPELKSLRVLGLGITCIDILASVPRYPEPEQKVRTTSVSVLGGGNTANALTAARRLGLSCTFISKLGDDMYGNVALRELQEDGIDIEHVVVKEGVNTSFTYVIVDTTNGTRTCLATASNEDLLPTEIPPELLETVLEGVSLVVLDGRHTLAAIQLVKLARQKQLPVLLDIERERPHIRELLPYADYIVTNSLYPFTFFPEASDRIDAMQMLLNSSDARFVISTLGETGSIMVRKATSRIKSAAPDMLVQSRVVESYRNSQAYEVIECPAWPVDEVIDSTGSGDAFIGGITYGLVTRMPYERMLCLASRMASAKLAAVGARTALPRREDLPQTLLATLPVL